MKVTAFIKKKKKNLVPGELYGHGLLSSSKLPSSMGHIPSVYSGHQQRSQQLPKSQAGALGPSSSEPEL